MRIQRRLLFAAAMIAATALAAAPTRALTVVTDHNREFVEFLINVFAVESGLEVTLLTAETLEETLDWQAKDPTLRIDVMLSSDVAALERWKAEGLTAVARSEQIAARVPEIFRDADGHWVGVAQRARAIYVARRSVSDDAIATYEELADPRWRGRLCSRALDHAYNAQLLAAMIGHQGIGGARSWLERVRDNLGAPAEGNDRAQIKRVADGTCDLAIAYTNYRGFLSEAQRDVVDATAMIAPRFEDGATHVALTGAAIHADARHPEEALELLEFLVSDRAQRMFMRLSYEHPVATDVPLEGMVAEWGALSADWLSPAEIAALQPAANALIADVMGAE